MVYCIGSTKWLIYIYLVVVYAHQIGNDVGLWDLDVMSISPIFVFVPCDLIIPRCIFHEKKRVITFWHVLEHHEEPTMQDHHLTKLEEKTILNPIGEEGYRCF